MSLLRLLRTRGHWPPLERAIAGFSRLGEHSAIWFGVAAVGTLTDARRRSTYRQLTRTVATVEVVNALAKLAILRRRPHLEGLPPLAKTKSNRSCPSAHSAGAFAAARILSQAFPPAYAYGVALVMAASRPYLGVHYPSDVLAGALLGTVIAQWQLATAAGAVRAD